MPFTTDYVAAVVVAVEPESLTKLQKVFKYVHYYPDGNIPVYAAKEALLWLTPNNAIPVNVAPIAELPNLRHIQLVSAGAEKALPTAHIVAYAKGGETDRVTLSTAAGLHVVSIPNYVVAMVVNIYAQIPQQINAGRSAMAWVDSSAVKLSFDKVYAHRRTRGRTAGLLGYGALGRESARLLSILGMNIIAANTSGKALRQAGYVVPGTGDIQGTLPSKYYSTSDAASMKDFLSQCDVLVSSLPFTPKTKHFLNSEMLSYLPQGAAFINIGRGNLITNGALAFTYTQTRKLSIQADPAEELQIALDRQDHLAGAAIDVTDPEPLPDNHPLWSHPKLFITPHLSGDAEDELDLACDIFIANAKRIAAGEEVYNRVDFTRGY